MLISLSAFEMPFMIEVVIDLTVITDEFLKCRNRLETLHRSFSSSEWQVRIFAPIVCLAAT